MLNRKSVRKARQFLRKNAHATTADIHPEKFAAAAQEQGVGFSDLLKYISRLYSAGQNESFQRQEDIHAAAAAPTIQR